MKPCLLFLLSLFLIGNVATAEETVQLVRGENSVKVLIGPDVFTVYRFGTDRRKPFFQPVAGPGGYKLLREAVADEPPGTWGRKIFVASESAAVSGDDAKSATVHYADVFEVSKVEEDRIWIDEKQGWVQREDIVPLAATVTRLINDNPKPIKDRLAPEYYDHPHHKGIWFSVDEINDIKFWMEDSLITSQKVELVQTQGSPAVMKVVNHWEDKEGKPILLESTTISFFPDRLLKYSATLAPAGDDVHIGDTKEGMFAIRLPNSMRELAAGGPVTNSEAVQGTKEAWGKPSHWINYDGPVDGHLFGVTLMDSPRNPWESRYHVRDYGLFAVNPFGSGAYTKGTADAQPEHDRTLKKGETLQFTYGAWIHGDDVDADDINAVYEQFCQEP